MPSLLIIDNDSAFREEFLAFLAKCFPDLRVVVAGNCVQALREIRDNPPNVVFASIRLSDGNGLWLIRRIKTEHPEIACGVLSAFDQPEYIEAARASQADHFVCSGAIDREGLVAFVRGSLLRPIKDTRPESQWNRKAAR